MQTRQFKISMCLYRVYVNYFTFMQHQVGFFFLVSEYLLEVVAEQPKTKINARAIFW